MTLPPSPRWFAALALALLGLVAIASTFDGPRGPAERVSEGLVAFVALVTDEGGKTGAPKCCKSNGPSQQNQAPGVLSAAADTYDPRQAAGAERPGDPIDLRDRTPRPEPTPPKTIRAA